MPNQHRAEADEGERAENSRSGPNINRKTLPIGQRRQPRRRQGEPAAMQPETAINSKTPKTSQTAE
jgi:hypothetical protein